MRSEIYWINEASIGSSAIGTMARPRGNDWLEDEIRSLKAQGVDCLVSLLESSEGWELGLKDEGEVCRRLEIDFINFPIADVTVPGNEEAFVTLAKSLASKINAGKKVVAHCRMGIGRASLMAGAVLICLGMAPERVFDTIGQFRRLEVPDTLEQKEWLWKLSEKLR